MKTKFEFNDKEILDDLEEQEVDALNSQINAIVGRLKANTPVNIRGKYKGSSKNLRQSVIYEPATKDKKTIRVGYDEQHNYIGRFVNDGTDATVQRSKPRKDGKKNKKYRIHQDAQNHVNLTSAEIRKDILKEIKRGIKL